MRDVTAAEIEQVSGAQDTWVFTGEPVSVANVQAIKDTFYASVLNGAIGGAYAGAIRGGPYGALYGTLGGALLGGTSWALNVAISTPMVTYTPVITITEISSSTNWGSDPCF